MHYNAQCRGSPHAYPHILRLQRRVFFAQSTDRSLSLCVCLRLPSRSYQLEPSHHSHLETGGSPKKRQLPQLPTATRSFGRDHLVSRTETNTRQRGVRPTAQGVRSGFFRS